MSRSRHMLRVCLLSSLAVAGCTKDEPVAYEPDGGSPGPDAQPVRCTDRRDLKNVYWGDLHAHTSYSLDSYMGGNRNDPKDAYLYAKRTPTTGTLTVASAGGGTHTSTIDRPLDFLAVTDHAEYLMFSGQCILRLDAVGAEKTCTAFRSHGSDEQFSLGLTAGMQLALPSPSMPAHCNESEASMAACTRASMGAWSKLREAAALANEPCKFTAFIAYEWSAQTSGANLHRNVIFGGDSVPAFVHDYLNYPTAKELWRGLEGACTRDAGCEALTIPHNSNYSYGTMWDTASDPESVALMEKYQTLAEIYQHKGSSECMSGDPLGDDTCAFEESVGSLTLALYGGTQPAVDAGPGMVRNGLAKGLAAFVKTGTNPIELGFVGSTDTHNATPGDVREDTWNGHVAGSDDEPDKRLGKMPTFSPGGLTGVWAEQNSRDAIFAALVRRETFATSGPRIAVRFYAVPDAAEEVTLADLCKDPSFPEAVVARGGVAMGGRVSGAKSMGFVVSALRDDEDLARVDIVRLAADGTGDVSSRVVTLPVGDVSAPCVVYLDSTYEVTHSYVYYARVWQKPTPRWSHYDCQKAPQAADGGCEDGGILRRPIQERAWTSPVYVRPTKDAPRR